MGAIVGDALKASLNNTTHWPNGGRRTYAWLGDPTLRLQVTAPTRELKATRGAGGMVELRWTSSRASDVQYYVYWSLNGSQGPFKRLNTAPLSVTTFKDTNAQNGSALYQVRAAELVVTGSGSEGWCF